MLVNVASALVALGLIVGLCVALAVAIGRSLRDGERHAVLLLERLRGLRMSRALALLGIDPARYARERPTVELEAQMSRCAECDEPVRCEEALADQNSEGLDFCPNRAEFEKGGAPPAGPAPSALTDATRRH